MSEFILFDLADVIWEDCRNQESLNHASFMNNIKPYYNIKG